MPTNSDHVLTLEIVVEINKSVGCKGTMVNEGNLDFILGSVSDSTNVLKNAATLLYEIIKLHPFLDGNKRTAVVSMESYLEFHNHKVNLNDDELEKLVYGIAIDEYTKHEVEELLKTRIL